MASLTQPPLERPNMVRILLACFDPILSRYKQPLSSKLVVSKIPEPVYTDLVNWINREISDDALSDFVVESFGYISDSVSWKQGGKPEGLSKYSNVTIFTVVALLLRVKPHVLADGLPSQWKQALPLTFWMIKQASLGDPHVGLYLWVCYLLPLLNSHPQWRYLILKLAEIILQEPGALTKLEKHPFWRKQCLIPPSSFEILMRLATSSAEEDTTRFVEIYGSLKKVALAGALEFIQQMFTVYLRLAGEGNTVLAREAASICIWSLTNDIFCWKDWDDLYEENLEASVLLLETLVDDWKCHFFKLSYFDIFVIQTMRSFLLKNNEGITAGGANGYLYKKADKCCKVILGRLFPGRCSSLRGAWITDVVLVAVLVLFYLTVSVFVSRGYSWLSSGFSFS